MIPRSIQLGAAMAFTAALLAGCGGSGGASGPTETAAGADKTSINDVSTLKGKVAAVRGTAGLQIRMSAFIEAENAID